MSRVRVRWEETTTYDQVLEIEDFDPEDTDAIEDAIIDQANFLLHVEGVEERSVISAVVLPE